MSDQKPSGHVDDASGDVKPKDSVSYESFQKLLGEKKTTQADLAKARQQLEQHEQSILEAEGKLKEALENQKRISQQEREKGVGIFKKASEKAVRSQFKLEAEKLGCVDSDLAMKACDFSDLELTEDLEFDPEMVKQKLQELTKTKSYLFKKDFKLPADLNPSNSKIPTKGLSDLSEQELKQLLQHAK